MAQVEDGPVLPPDVRPGSWACRGGWAGLPVGVLPSNSTSTVSGRSVRCRSMGKPALDNSHISAYHDRRNCGSAVFERGRVTPAVRPAAIDPTDCSSARQRVTAETSVPLRLTDRYSCCTSASPGRRSAFAGLRARSPNPLKCSTKSGSKFLSVRGARFSSVQQAAAPPDRAQHRLRSAALYPPASSQTATIVPRRQSFTHGVGRAGRPDTRSSGVSSSGAIHSTAWRSPLHHDGQRRRRADVTTRNGASIVATSAPSYNE